jgi:hypothetical protein
MRRKERETEEEQIGKIRKKEGTGKKRRRREKTEEMKETTRSKVKGCEEKRKKTRGKSGKAGIKEENREIGLGPN